MDTPRVSENETECTLAGFETFVSWLPRDNLLGQYKQLLQVHLNVL